MACAVSSLQQLRRERAIPTNAPVSFHEHEFALAMERQKLQEFTGLRYAKVPEETMETDDIMSVPTMVERTVVECANNNNNNNKDRVSSKRSATVTPCPEEARGRCVGCHMPIEFGKAYCGPCFLQSPDGRAKRARIAVVADARAGQEMSF